MIKSFPKIFTLGQDYINDIFQDEVEITEKIDGSQLNFGRVHGTLFVRSKGAEIFADNPPKMFKLGVDYILSIRDRLPDNTIFHCEYLGKPKHNVLAYSRVPKNNIILFGVSDTSEKFNTNYRLWADKLGVEYVPVLFNGVINSIDELMKYFDIESILGGCKIEGMVVKNYTKPVMLGSVIIPVCMGKYVSEKFKEVHQKEWKTENTSMGKFDIYKQGFRSEARWQKAIQHLKEQGLLENSPKDIGKLMAEIKNDIETEEKENIKNFLWKEFNEEILRKSTAGFPEWYKEQLLKNIDFESDKSFIGGVDKNIGGIPE